jgi:hypothetical protein
VILLFTREFAHNPSRRVLAAVARITVTPSLEGAHADTEHFARRLQPSTRDVSFLDELNRLCSVF